MNPFDYNPNTEKVFVRILHAEKAKEKSKIKLAEICQPIFAEIEKAANKGYMKAEYEGSFDIGLDNAVKNYLKSFGYEVILSGGKHCISWYL